MVEATAATEVLLLAPSEGLGGGIERYAAAIDTILAAEGIATRRLNLCDPRRPLTAGSRMRFVRDVRQAVRSSRRPVRLVVTHVNLLPVLEFVSRLPAFCGACVIVHGVEVWSGRRLRGRRWLRRPDVRVSAVSNFSAGALTRTCRTSILPPGISPEWYDTLVRASTSTRPPDDELHLITAFRLAGWRDKGLGTVLAAICSLDDPRIRLTVCGRGPVPTDLHAAVARLPWCQVRPDPSDQELAHRLAHADGFVLATRTRDGARPSGEGFGLVLLEAQLAGTPVIAPAYGGSGDAFQPGLTGVAPIDETPAALAHEIAQLLAQDKRREEMGHAAAAWSRTRFDPETYRRQLVRTILGPAITDRPPPSSLIS